MKYCHNCGTQLTDGDVFCTNCGTKTESLVAASANESALTPASPMQNAATGYGFEYSVNSTPKNKNTPLIVAIAIAAFVIIAVCAVFVFGALSGSHNSPEKVMEAVEDAYNSQNVDAFCELVCPPHIRRAMIEMNGGDDYIRQQIIDMFEELTDEYGRNYHCDITVLSKSPLDRDEYVSIFESLNEMYNINLEEACELTCGLVVRYDGTYEDMGETDITMYKIDGKWYASMD